MFQCKKNEVENKFNQILKSKQFESLEAISQLHKALKQSQKHPRNYKNRRTEEEIKNKNYIPNSRQYSEKRKQYESEAIDSANCKEINDSMDLKIRILKQPVYSKKKFKHIAPKVRYSHKGAIKNETENLSNSHLKPRYDWRNRTVDFSPLNTRLNS